MSDLNALVDSLYISCVPDFRERYMTKVFYNFPLCIIAEEARVILRLLHYDFKATVKEEQTNRKKILMKKQKLESYTDNIKGKEKSLNQSYSWM